MKITFQRCIILCTFAMLTLTAGCEAPGPRTAVSEKIGKVMDEAVATNAEANKVPEAVAEALLPTIDLSSTKLPKVESQDRFDISVSEVPADQFFLSLVDGTPYNIVIHPEVKGNITLNLQNVGIPDVLEAVRDVYGYEFVSTPYGFQVLPGRLQARIYQINYLNVERAGDSSTLVSSGALTTGNSRNEENGNTGNNNSGGGNNNNSSTTQTFGTQIHTSQPKSTFWAELRESIAAIVGKGEGRDVVVNPQSGVVVVRALPTELREVETFLRATQLIVQDRKSVV